MFVGLFFICYNRRILSRKPRHTDFFSRSLIAIQAGVSKEDMAVVTATRKYRFPVPLKVLLATMHYSCCIATYL
jgi:hypothetical protein